MATVQDVAERLKASAAISEPELESLIAASDVMNHKVFLSGDGVKEAVRYISTVFVEQFFNNPDPNQVPIRRKTKFVLVLNNFALNKGLRSTVLNALKNMDSIFEESMKKEGTMPFDSELGRMSEHVLVLLMRVCNYKLKAAQVHEFAENNTQFAVQLLLAILLKEPPYEFELRCNCISGLLGFTQPQAFFQVTDKIELQECGKFNEKVDFISNLMLRLSAVHVVNDVLATNLLEFPTVQPVCHLACVNIMRCIMNIFQFVSQGATQWRQHVLLSTNFIDATAILYVQNQTRTLESALTVNLTGRAPSVAPDLLPGIGLALKFMAFGTFHMGRHAACLRPLCTFFYDMLQLPVHLCFVDDKLTTQLVGMYTQLFHFMANIDALAGDSGITEDPSDLIPELQSQSLKKSIADFIKAELAVAGQQTIAKFHTKFATVENDALVAHDCRTFQDIDAIFQAALAAAAPAAPAPAPAAPVAQPAEPKKSLLGDMPALGKPKNEPKQAVAQEPVQIQQSFVAPKPSAAAAPSAASNSRVVCALNGHTLKVPVDSPYGHTFEKETIEQWIRQQGPVCPITGKPLRIEDLKPNKTLQNEIMQLVVQQSMSAVNQEDDMDLYDF